MEELKQTNSLPCVNTLLPWRNQADHLLTLCKHSTSMEELKQTNSLPCVNRSRVFTQGKELVCFNSSMEVECLHRVRSWSA